MKKKAAIIILIVSLLLDVQRVSAADSNFHTVNGTITSTADGTIYWSDGSDTYYFYSQDNYKVGDKITNVMSADGKHVFIGVNENA